MLKYYLYFWFPSLLLSGGSVDCSKLFFSFFSYCLCSSLEAHANGKMFSFFSSCPCLLTGGSSKCSDVFVSFLFLSLLLTGACSDC